MDISFTKKTDQIPLILILPDGSPHRYETSNSNFITQGDIYRWAKRFLWLSCSTDTHIPVLCCEGLRLSTLFVTLFCSGNSGSASHGVLYYIGSDLESHFQWLLTFFVPFQTLSYWGQIQWPWPSFGIKEWDTVFMHCGSYSFKSRSVNTHRKAPPALSHY